jgi:hypothetical protein
MFYRDFFKGLFSHRESPARPLDTLRKAPASNLQEPDNSFKEAYSDQTNHLWPKCCSENFTEFKSLMPRRQQPGSLRNGESVPNFLGT